MQLSLKPVHTLQTVISTLNLYFQASALAPNPHRLAAHYGFTALSHRQWLMAMHRDGHLGGMNLCTLVALLHYDAVHLHPLGRWVARAEHGAPWGMSWESQGACGLVL